jgi:hypothetical protein
MSGSISLNPYSTNQPANTFPLTTQGYVQGAPMDDPTSRLWLSGGSLKETETLPMWGGVPIFEYINVEGSPISGGPGPQVGRATSQATVTGWSTNLQINSMVITPGNSVPLAAIGNSVGYFRLTTNVRLAVAIDPALVTTISGSPALINAEALYWDVTNYRITTTTTGGNFALPTSTRLLGINTNSKIVTYASSVASWSAGSAAIILI